MKRTLILVIAALMMVPVAASARMGYYKKFKANYPDATKLAGKSCLLCHQNTESFERNPYGMDVEKTLANNGGSPDFAAIEALDSDGDSFTNGEEIKADTAPGDKDEHPASH